MSSQAKLEDLADLNPKLPIQPDSSEPVSFVRMTDLDVERASTPIIQARIYADVAKGYTGMVNGDLLVAKITPCFQNGKIGQADLPTDIGMGSTEFHVIRPQRDLVDERYLLHFLRQPWVRVAGEKRMTGSGGQRRIPARFLAELVVPTPPIPEQRRIAEILDRADALRTKRREAIAKLDSLTQSIFVDMFGDTRENPHGWERVRLSQYVADGDSINYGVVQPGVAYPNGVPLVRVGDLQGGHVRMTDLKRISPVVEAAYARSRLKGDELLVSCVGSIGEVALADERLAGANVARAVARVRLQRYEGRPFVAASLKSVAVQDYFRNEARTVSQPTLNIKQLAATPIFNPPIALQMDFAERVQAVGKTQAAALESQRVLNALFASLQQSAFAGELRAAHSKCD